MKERRQIVEKWQRGMGSVLVTLVRVQGSSYRRSGARLLLCSDGSYEGAVSAGCLEADLLRKAAWLIRDGASLERYSTLFDEDSEVPFGLGCGGVLELLLEPVASPECQALMLALDSSLAGQESRVATWLPGPDQRLMRAIFRMDGALIFASEGLSAEAISRAWIAASQEQTLEDSSRVVETLGAPQRLFVFGAGNDAKPLVSMASLLGWRVVIADSRSNLVRKERFSDPTVQIASDPEAAVREISARDAVVIMTHSFEQDRDILAAVLPLKPRYLGLLGSRQRSSILIADAAARLNYPVSACCELVSAPIGLDIGGEGAEAIALAIVAEVQACCSAKRIHTRKLSEERVLQYLSESDLHRYLSTQCSLGT